MAHDDRLPSSSVEVAPEAEGTRWSRDERRVLVFCLLASAIPLADMGLMNVAIPSIVRDLHLGVGETKAVVALHALAFGALLVPGGRLGDCFGQRRLLVLGLAGFALGCVAAACAPSAGWLLAARIVQGASAGILSPQVGGLIQRSFAGQARARAFGMMGATIAVATATGPVLGGILLGVVPGDDAWRVTLLLGLVALVPLAAIRILPPDQPRTIRDLDLVAVVMMALLALSALMPLVLGVTTWWSALFLVLVPATAFLTWWERRYQRRGRLPLLPPALLQDRLWARGTVLIGFFLAGSTALPLLVSLHAQLVLGTDALHAGLAMLPYAVCSALGAVIAGKWVLRTGARVIGYGCLLFIVPLAILLLIGPPADGAGAGHVIVSLVLLSVAGLGTGTVISPNQTLSYRNVPPALSGNASGLLLTAQRIGGASGAAVITALFFAGGDEHTGGGTGSALAAVVVLAVIALGVLVVSGARARTSAR